MITPGKYKAHIVDHGITKTKEGLPQVAVKFEIVETGNSINWFGSFKGGAKEITAVNLARLGMKGVDPSVLHRETDTAPLALDTETEFELVVENHTYNNKTNPRIKFINRPGESGGFGVKVDKAEVKSLFAGMNLGAKLIEARKKLGVSDIEETDVPF